MRRRVTPPAVLNHPNGVEEKSNASTTAMTVFMSVVGPIRNSDIMPSEIPILAELSRRLSKRAQNLAVSRTELDVRHCRNETGEMRKSVIATGKKTKT
jgi:hypothetical protein